MHKHAEMLISCYLGSNFQWAALRCTGGPWQCGNCLTYLELHLSTFLVREGGRRSLQQGRKCSWSLTVNSRTLRTQLRSRVSRSMLHSNRRPLRPCEPGLAKIRSGRKTRGTEEGRNSHRSHCKPLVDVHAHFTLTETILLLCCSRE